MARAPDVLLCHQRPLSVLLAIVLASRLASCNCGSGQKAAAAAAGVLDMAISRMEDMMHEKNIPSFVRDVL